VSRFGGPRQVRTCELDSLVKWVFNAGASGRLHLSGLSRLAGSLALRLFEAVEASNRRQTRLAASTVGMLATFGLWLVHLRNPSLFFSHHGPLGELIYIVVLVPPFITVFNLGHLLFPDVENPLASETGPMSGYLQSEKARKRWKISITAGVLAAGNLLCMILSSRPT